MLGHSILIYTFVEVNVFKSLQALGLVIIMEILDVTWQVQFFDSNFASPSLRRSQNSHSYIPRIRFVVAFRHVSNNSFVNFFRVYKREQRSSRAIREIKKVTRARIIALIKMVRMGKMIMGKREKTIRIS